MAEGPSDQPNEPAKGEELEFFGMGDVVALHADAFFVLQNGDNFTIYFFQHDIPPLAREIQKTEAISTKRTKCFARIAVSQMGFVNLTQALVQHATQAGLVRTASTSPSVPAKDEE
jgi:hypothetical protein